MPGIKNSSCWTLYVLLTIFSLLAELGLNLYLAYFFWMRNQKTWSTVIMSLVIVPSLVVQGISMYFYRAYWHSSRLCNRILLILTHFLQLSLILRYVQLIKSSASVTHSDIKYCLNLRLLFTTFSSLPLICIQVFTLLKDYPEINLPHQWSPFVSLIATASSIIWILATYKNNTWFCCPVGVMYTWSVLCIRLLWKTGEIVCRVTALMLFTSALSYWLFLVLGFHWIIMVSLNALLGQPVSAKKSQFNSVLSVLFSSSLEVFSYVNVSNRKVPYGLAFFYIFCFVENAALVALFIFYDNQKERHFAYAVFVAGTYAFALIFALIYKNCLYTLNDGKEDNLKTEHSHVSFSHNECEKCAIFKKSIKSLEIDPEKPWISRVSNLAISSSNATNPEKTTNHVPSTNIFHQLDPSVVAVNLGSHRLLEHQPDNSDKESSKWTNAKTEFLSEQPNMSSTPVRSSRASTKASLDGPTSDKDFYTEVRKCKRVKSSSKGTPDHGYFSTLSTTSKESSQRHLQEIGSFDTGSLVLNSVQLNGSQLLNAVALHKRTRPHLGTSSYDSASSSCASAKRLVLSCQRCGHKVHTDSLSLYSESSAGNSHHSSGPVTRSVDNVYLASSRACRKAKARAGKHQHACKHDHAHSYKKYRHNQTVSDSGQIWSSTPDAFSI